MAKKRHCQYIAQAAYIERTYEVSTERVMDLCESTTQRVQLGTSLPALLEFSLQSAQDVVECETTLPWCPHIPTHTAHADKPLRLQGRSPLRTRRAIGATLTVAGEVERAVACAWLIGHLPKVALRVLFGALCGLRLKLGENAHDARCDLVVHDRLVVLANDVDTEFLRGGGRRKTQRRGPRGVNES